MKTSKIIHLFALCFFLLSANIMTAQECRTKPTTQNGPIIIDYPNNSTILEVPTTLRSKLALSKATTENSKTVFQYVEALGGCTSIVFDKENQIIAIAVPKSSGIDPKALIDYFARNEDPTDDCDGAIDCVATAIMDLLTILSR